MPVNEKVSVTMIDLKRLFKKSDIVGTIDDICTLAGGNLSVLNSQGEPLSGEKLIDPLALRIPVHVSGQVICWIVGKPESKTAVNILKHLITAEIEKIKLAGETLEKYKELNILYGLSEKISSTIDLKDISEYAISQMRKTFKCDSGCVLMLSPEHDELEPVSDFGDQEITDIICGYHKRGDVTTIFHPEIVNDISSDPRFNLFSKKIASLIFVPIIHGFNPLGMMAAGSLNKHEYTARDLNSLNVLAQQISGTMSSSLARKKKLDALTEGSQ